MALPVECQRLRLGGTVSGSTITGGTLIETPGKNLRLHETYLGIPSKKTSNLAVPWIDGDLARVGSSSTPGKFYRPRLFTLSIIVYGYDDDGLILTSGQCEEMETNLDEVKGLLSSEALITMERDWADGTTRFLQMEQTGEAIDRQGAVKYSRTLDVPCVAPYPFWQSSTLNTETVDAGGGTVTNAGNAPIGNLIAVFAGDSVLTHTEYGATLEVSGSASAVTVDCGARTVTQAGSAADNLLTRNRAYWIRLPKGGGNFTRSAADVTLSWRDQWL